MVKKLVHLHGGSVSAQSEGEGRGATFTVRLPLSGVPRPRPADPALPRAQGRRRRVLLIEDNADIVELIHMQLELWGHEVASAADGPSGLAAALSFHPDVALLDVGLPGMDGYELARRIRRHPEGASIRLIAMTGYGRPEDRDRALQAGFDAHLVKPVEPAQLQELLEAEVQARP
jgi:CheY-like chemotaxis protein